MKTFNHRGCFSIIALYFVTFDSDNAFFLIVSIIEVVQEHNVSAGLKTSGS